MKSASRRGRSSRVIRASRVPNHNADWTSKSVTHTCQFTGIESRRDLFGGEGQADELVVGDNDRKNVGIHAQKVRDVRQKVIDGAEYTTQKWTVVRGDGVDRKELRVQADVQIQVAIWAGGRGRRWCAGCRA